MTTKSSIRASPEVISALKQFKEAYGFHSLEETILQLLTSAKVKILKTEEKENV